jgi:hypothetical protein
LVTSNAIGEGGYDWRTSSILLWPSTLRRLGPLKD